MGRCFIIKYISYRLNRSLKLWDIWHVLEGRTNHATWSHSNNIDPNKENINIVYAHAHFHLMTPLDDSCTSNQQGDASILSHSCFFSSDNQKKWKQQENEGSHVGLESYGETSSLKFHLSMFPIHKIQQINTDLITTMETILWFDLLRRNCHVSVDVENCNSCI